MAEVGQPRQALLQVSDPNRQLGVLLCQHPDELTLNTRNNAVPDTGSCSSAWQEPGKEDNEKSLFTCAVHVVMCLAGSRFWDHYHVAVVRCRPGPALPVREVG